jgi:hypothetical protein
VIPQVLDIHVRATARIFADRSSTVGASDVGQCARKVFFGKTGADTDPDYVDSWGARERGNLIENCLWEPGMRRYFGNRLLFAGADQKTFTSGYLSATPDGLIVGCRRDILTDLGIDDIGGNCILVECKSIDPRASLDQPKSEHRYQAIVQLGLVRELTPYKPVYCIISYMNASFLDDIVEFPIAFDPTIFEVAKTRAAMIMAAKSPQEVRPEGWIAGGRECEFCPYTHACGTIRRAVPSYAEVVDDPEIAALGRIARQRREEAEAATAAQREVENEIKERLRKRGARKVESGNVSITYSSVKGRPAFDWPKIREAAESLGLDLKQFENTGDPTDRLTITVREPFPALPEGKT